MNAQRGEGNRGAHNGPRGGGGRRLSSGTERKNGDRNVRLNVTRDSTGEKEGRGGKSKGAAQFLGLLRISGRNGTKDASYKNKQKGGG